jgi:hypothetical protein
MARDDQALVQLEKDDQVNQGYLFRFSRLLVLILLREGQPGRQLEKSRATRALPLDNCG